MEKADKPIPSAELRQLAEAKLGDSQPESSAEKKIADTQRLLHELQVHQIELELQNEDLLRTRTELEHALTQYSDLYDFAPVGYFTLAGDGSILQVNLNGARLLGIERARLVQRRFGLFVAEAWRRTFHAFLERVFDQGRKEYCEVSLVQSEADNPMWLCLEATVTEDRQACRVAAMDVSARHRAQEDALRLNAELEQRVEARTQELRRAQEQLVSQEKLAVIGQLASGVSHELRNPINVINNAIYFLTLIQPDASAQVKEYLAIIKHETHTAQKIITDLLDFARVTFTDRQKVSLPNLAESVLQRFPPAANITLNCRLPHDLPPVFVDPQHAEQILGNLIVNACQAMPDGGELTISAAQQGAEIAMAVQDSGMGISAENMRKLFEPLFTTKTKGIGLGLAVSKKLLEANGGRIEVQSEPGNGSTFTLILPVYQGAT